MLETDRLILKPFVQENLSTVIEMLQDKDFMAFSPYGDLTTEAAKTRFFEILEHYKNYNFDKMAIVLKDTHQIIGYCGFENCEVDGKKEAELGFRIIKSERNKGYIVEASLKLIEDMKNRNFKHVIAFSEKDNLPAHNLLAKLGFIKTNSSHYLNMEVCFFKKDL
ncbi:GNAT family N-acetyltransferase [Acinetobacter baumannii]|uniref:GNAT family N-acetyltransferase n=1 Tax=Acinetobacter baumannii TaxID=470 RepID=UPI0022B31B90|nr:GNAT family N-acetyltransferase [Acinetobacter baumannii]MDC5012594.1 GNAT family N-acetyltransferase [Acinetobacter baumannii]MDV4252519.1 GNAT family N-acetyltransferase [Acinetobacter baumannii]HEM7108851.1 GNAT family N-acetyltransferase [Acinetobacter baumannii]